MPVSDQEAAVAIESLLWSLPADRVTPADPAVRALLVALGVSIPALLTNLSDESLARAYQAGLFRREVFEEWFVNRYERSLRRWFSLNTGRDDLAEDLTQEFYVKLLLTKTLEQYDSEHPFRPWFWRVARNFLHDAWRHRRTTYRLPSQEVGTNGFDPVEEAIAGELRARVEALLEALPEDQRRVFARTLEGRSTDAIATEFNLPKKLVYRLVFESRRAIEGGLEAAGFFAPSPTERRCVR